MPWTIRQQTLDDAGVFPLNLFSEEGQYRLDIYVTDWSLGGGNPHDTTDGINTNDDDGFIDKGYTIGGTGSASARVFFIDRTDPVLKWSSVTEGKTYYKNDDFGQVSFGFETKDANTIQRWEAVISEGPTVVLRNGNMGSPAVGTAPGGRIPALGIDPAETDTQNMSVSPFMTDSAGTTALDLVGGNKLPVTYTITLTVADGARKEASITKQFILDNNKPVFAEKVTPASYENTNSATWEIITGRMSVKGNAEDNSNMLSRTAFYVVRGKDSANFTDFPKPEAIDDADWHWHDPDNTDNYRIRIPSVNGTPVMQIEQGTFTWEIRAPQSSLFMSLNVPPAEKDYVQWTYTGPGKTYMEYNASTGLTAGPTQVPDLTYQDLAGRKIGDGQEVGLMTVYVLVEDMAGNKEYKVLKYWLWPEGDRPQIVVINNPDINKIKAERMLNGSIRISGMARDNERVENVWFRVMPSKDGVVGEPPYKLEVPVWDRDKDWAEVPGQYQKPNDNISSMGSRNDTIPDSGGWYMANGGGAKNVNWWAIINTQSELDPLGLDLNEITVEVRAQDITWDDGANDWMKYDPYNPDYFGLSGKPMSVAAWVVAGAPIFDDIVVTNATSVQADTPSHPAKWEPIDKLNLRARSAYRVTVRHTAGISAIRWTPTQWAPALNGGEGGFRPDPNAAAKNLLELEAFGDDYYVYRVNGGYYVQEHRDDVFPRLENSMSDVGMAVTVKPRGMSGNLTGKLDTGKKYLIWKWDEALRTSGVLAHDPSYLSSDGITYKDMKNTIFSPANTGADIGSAVIMEAEDEDGTGYFKWDVTVDARADRLLKEIEGKGYGMAEGQVIGSVRYPVYLSATDASRSTPLNTSGDTLLPLDNKDPEAMYTLNRRPAGTAATIGGEAADNGPVSGVARVVLWFSRLKAGDPTRKPLSWHETAALGTPGVFVEHASGSGPIWWDDMDAVAKWNADHSDLPPVPKPAIGDETSGTGGDSAIVIDRNDPKTGTNHHGHKLAMGFADGGIGRQWYVEINSLGIESGPVTLHYVVMDKAGNSRYYYETLIIMNSAPVINRVRLATDIRYNAGFQSLWDKNISEASGALTPETSPLLKEIRDRVPWGKTDVERGISDYIYSSALGAEKLIDFNARNNLFALRVETTGGAGPNKTRAFRLEYVSGAELLSNSGARKLEDIKAGRVYIIEEPGIDPDLGHQKWGAVGAEGDGPWKKGDVFLAAVNGRNEEGGSRFGDNKTGSVWELNSGYYDGAGKRVNVPPKLQLDDAEYPLDTVKNDDAQSAEFVYNWSAFIYPDASPRTGIADYGGPDNLEAWPPASGDNPALNNSMFILRVFDGDEADMFGDFKIIRIRVNNRDKTKPFAQLHDLNPKTEGQERSAVMTQAQMLTPMFIGEGANSNRLKGGLWNTAPTPNAVAKSGHIEPRRITSAYLSSTEPYKTYGHSLTSAQMGGAATKSAATITKPFADPAGFFAADTVSGQVVLRGYVEDDQRVARVAVRIGIGNDVPDINILVSDNKAPTEANNGSYTPGQTGLLQVPAAQDGKVYFTDSIDLYRHRVEWAYVWDTETVPSNFVVGNLGVDVYSYTANTNLESSAIEFTNAQPGIPHTAADNYNPGFPVGMRKYSRISMNVRPYMTGFLRDRTTGDHNIRSRQGRYSFRQSEYVLFTGFNFDRPGTTGSLTSLKRWSSAQSFLSNSAITTALAPNYGITAANTNNARYKRSTGSGGTGDGVVGFYVSNGGNYYAVNTSAERPMQTNGRPYIQPWNIEYNPAAEGSELWDDYTQVHIWRSDDTTGNEGGRFATTDNWSIYSPSMSIDPNDGTLYESHNALANGMAGRTPQNVTRTTPISAPFAVGGDYHRPSSSDYVYIYVSTPPNNPPNIGDRIKYYTYNGKVYLYAYYVTRNDSYWNGYETVPVYSYIRDGAGNYQLQLNNGNERDVTSDEVVMSAGSLDFYFSDVYRSPGSGTTPPSTWVVASLIGGGNTTAWFRYGGIRISGPYGTQHRGESYAVSGNTYYYDSNASIYQGESAWYNNSADNGRLANPRMLDQFMNPHIVSSYSGSYEYIHVSYYDAKDGSIKYRSNFIGGPGNINGGESNTDAAAIAANKAVPKMWANLDGGVDADDADETTYTGNMMGPGAGGTIAANARVVRWNTSTTATATGRRDTGTAQNVDAGRHNSIDVTSEGYPVIAYYDETNKKLKLAVSRYIQPTRAQNWVIRDNVIPTTNDNHKGTGEYVSMKIDTRSAPNIIHIAAMNTNKRLVYITGKLNPTAGTVGTYGGQQSDGGVLTDVKVQALDSLGAVGKWCSLSLDAQGNPWITYMDENYLGARDGVKAAYLNKGVFYKGSSGYFPSEYVDIYGESLDGWEIMNVPTAFRVENPIDYHGYEHGRLGLECYPTRMMPTAPARQWSAAFSYLSQEGGDRYRVAYYMK
jgi:hypothetical protein